MTAPISSRDLQANSFEELTVSNHQSLRDLHTYWLQKKGDLIAPPRAAIRPEEIVAFLPTLALIDVVGDPPRFRYRLFGTQLAKAYGQDLTGKFVDEIDLGGTLVPEIIARATEVVRECRVQVGRSRFTKRSDERRVEYQRILLPLSDDGRTVHMILCGYAIEKAYG